MTVRFLFQVFSLVYCFGALPALAQPPLHIICNIDIDKGSKEGSKIVIDRDGQKWKIRSGDDPKTFMELESQHEYLFSFMKKDYVTKKIFISTKMPSTIAKSGFKTFPFEVTLFKQVDGVNIQIFDQPVAKIIYDSKLGDFTYDTDYSSSIMSDMRNAENQLKQNKKPTSPAVKPNTVEPARKIQSTLPDSLSKSAEGRQERQYMEGEKNVTEVTITKKGRKHVYRKVSYVWGVFYFCDNVNITEASYIQNALEK